MYRVQQLDVMQIRVGRKFRKKRKPLSADFVMETANYLLRLIVVLANTAENMAKGCESDEIVTVKLTNGIDETTISKCDYERVMQLNWGKWCGYANNPKIGKLHAFIIGPRPADVPADWVIDHIDRNPLHNPRPNLRWVSRCFNTFNRITTKGSSRFKGVSWDKKSKKWVARFRNKSIGWYDNEREAAKAATKEMIRYWPLWAPSSDLLVGPDLLSSAEIARLQYEILREAGDLVQPVRSLPKGIYQRGEKFMAMYRNKSLGCHETLEQAQEVLQRCIQSYQDQQWQQHLLLPILRNERDVAIIPLSGKMGEGKVTEVPDQFWHLLTYEHSWCFDGQYAAGRWEGKSIRLHSVVYKLCHPEWDGQKSIDHKKPEEKLNNTENNLRLATGSLQGYNKPKRQGCSSQYIGVSKAKNGRWQAHITFNGHNINVGGGCFSTERDAAIALNLKARELMGDEARTLIIED